MTTSLCGWCRVRSGRTRRTTGPTGFRRRSGTARHRSAPSALSVVGQVQQHRVERVEVDVDRVPAGVKVSGLVLSGDEAAVNQTRRQPASASSSSSSSASASPSSNRRRRSVHPNRSTTSSHDATCSPGGSRPLSGSNGGSTPQHYHCVLASGPARSTIRVQSLCRGARDAASVVVEHRNEFETCTGRFQILAQR